MTSEMEIVRELGSETARDVQSDSAGRSLADIRVMEIGGSLASRYCGRLLAELGAEVVSCTPSDSECEHRAGPRLERYLDAGKLVLRGEWSGIADQLLGADAQKQITLGVAGGTAAEVIPLADRLASAGIDLVALTPFGIYGSRAKATGGDLIASHSGGYAMHMSVQGMGIDPETGVSLQTGPRYQASLYAGLCAAMAVMSLIIDRRSQEPPRLLDLSEQECVADVIYAEMEKVRDGMTGWPKITGGSGAATVGGGVVGMLPCSDGYVMTSPREDHQWRRLAELIGRGELADDSRFCTSKNRFAHWNEAVQLIGRWSSLLPRQEVARRCQEAHVPCFPLNRMGDAAESSSPALQRPWLRTEEAREFWPRIPFRVAEENPVGGKEPTVGEEQAAHVQVRI